MKGKTMNNQNSAPIAWSTLAGLSVVGIIGLLMWGCPQYNVWQQGLAGQAELERARQNKQITIEAAKAKLDAAEFLNKAEVKRAAGVAEANSIIGDSLKGQDAYLRYLWITGMTENETTNPSIIYIPTEAGLPILEAGKR
jgi:regulator of protease activity HflC (stomatin/prohibitin superfamily)